MMVNTCNDLDASPERYAEKSQFQVGTHCMIPFIQCSRNDKIIEMTRLVVQDVSRRGGCGSKGWLGDPGGVGQSCVATVVVVTQSEMIQNYIRSAPI